jgi:hypothetical protein
VLEHVPEPLALLKHVSSFVKPAGYLYIELPQDLSDAQITEFKHRPVRLGVPIHEHINAYCIQSLTCLVKAAGLDLISIESTAVELGWITGTNLRALCGRWA